MTWWKPPPSCRCRAIPAISASQRRAAEFGERIEYCLQIERRAADDLEHIGGGGLLLKGFTQLTEQPRVLDGDDGLRGEIGYEFDLDTCEWMHL